MIDISFQRLILFAFSVGLICRLAFAFCTPLFYAPDEHSHFNYVKYLYEKKEFPVQTAKTEGTQYELEYHQAPLYYMALLPGYWVCEQLFSGKVYIKLILFRLFSVMLWIINAMLALKILSQLKIEDSFVKATVLSMVCLLPTYTFLSSAMNNDNLLISIGAAILYLLASERTNLNSLLIGLLLGLAMLTKGSGIIYVIAIGILLLLQSKERIHYTIILLIGLIIWSPWAVRNWQVYGDVMAEEAPNTLVQWGSISEAIIYTQHYMKASFWAVSGVYNNIEFVPAIGIILTYAAAAGLLYRLLIRRDIHFLATEKSRFLLALGTTILINALLVMRYGILWGQGQGRHLYPMLIPIALFIGVGLNAIIPQKLKKTTLYIVLLFIGYLIAFTVYSISVFPPI